jgi:hypothetical protein
LNASRGGFDQEPFPLGEAVTVGVVARLSVPDALELADRKHENTGATRALLGRTWDPELCLTGHRAQRLDPSHTAAGPCPDKGQHVTYLIVVNPDYQRGQTAAAHCRVALNLRCRRPDRSEIR